MHYAIIIIIYYLLLQQVIIITFFIIYNKWPLLSLSLAPGGWNRAAWASTFSPATTGYTYERFIEGAKVYSHVTMGNAQQAQTAGPILALGVVPAKSLVPAHTLTVTCDKMDRFNLGSASRRSRKDLRLSNGNRAFTCACLSTGKAILVAGDAD